MAGIVVVTYNSADVIDACLEACLQIAGAEIVVVDNASSDETVNRVRQWNRVQLIANANNRGFAGGVNQGMSALPLETAVLILNPDVTLVAGIAKLEEAVHQEGVGAATGRLLEEDGGDEQHGFNVRTLPTPVTLAFEILGLNRIWPSNPVNRRYRSPTPKTQGNVEQPAGAFLMLHRSAWDDVGGFDEGFFPIWFEDVDYCKRLHDRKYRIVFIPEAIAQHQGGHSARKLLWRERQLIWYGSLLRYASKHFSGASRAAVSLAVVLGILPRAVIAIRRVGIVEAMSVLLRVVGLTGQYLRTGERGRSPVI